jgi:hypothetical protein
MAHDSRAFGHKHRKRWGRKERQRLEVQGEQMKLAAEIASRRALIRRLRIEREQLRLS